MDEAGMVICDTCFCVVEASTESMQGHSDWHDSLKKDEDDE